MLRYFRPITGLYNAITLTLFMYAIGVMATPNSGIANLLATRTPLSQPVVGLMFIICGILIFIWRPQPAIVSVLLFPLLAYAIAGVFFFFEAGPFGSITGSAAHFGLWVIASAALYEKARRI